MQKTRGIYVGRLNRFLDSSLFSSVNIRSVLYKHIAPLSDIEVYGVPGLAKPPFHLAIQGAFIPCSLGDQFGPSWSTHWFRFSVKPEDFREEMYLEWRAGCEGLLYYADGSMIAAVSEARDHELACNQLGGLGKETLISPPSPDRFFQLERAHLVVYNGPARRLFMALTILQGMVKCLEGTVRGEQALFLANEILNSVDLTSDTLLESAANRVGGFLQQPSASEGPVVHAVGHCHIDTAWLWDYAETRRKCARSWASQCELMSRFPEYKFACSQMVQLQWIHDDYPGLFAVIKEFAATGQFIPIGGTWVEMDGNMPSGEAMIRQFLYGQRFMVEHFGHKSDVFWLPDTFGYCGQLPQIMRHCGVKYFLSQKLSWNNINQFPHNSFHWIALDGRSSVLAHFPPANTYGANAEPHELLNTTKLNKDKDRTSAGLLLYGHGDGGGGPTEEMLLNLRLMKDCDGLGRVEHADPIDFFKGLEQADSDKLLRWNGELYFELHRGTYTSQALCKQFNRRCEEMMRVAEFVAILAHMISKSEYPKAQLETLWKTILLNQFHDVLPGSSINKVYKDAVRLYEQVQLEGRQIIYNSINSITGPGNTLTVFNPLSFSRSEVLKLPEGKVIVRDVPPLSFKTVDLSSAERFEEAAAAAFISPHYVLKNAFVMATFDEKGRLISFHDLVSDREVMVNGQLGNQLLLFEDIPHFWDAWDVELYHLEKYTSCDTNCDVTIKASGPVVASLERRVRLSDNSCCVQLISLDGLSPQLSFDCRVEWHESHQLLKVEFPLAIHTDHAIYETQYGLISRPVHDNTLWDVAKFEVCGLRFMALSEYGFGCALLSDSKYGYSVWNGNRVRLSLLRSPKNPDPECDMGAHGFKFALLPYNGDIAKVVQAAACFSSPLIWSIGGESKAGFAGLNLFSLDGLVIDCIKQAERNNDLIIRAYEPCGGRGRTELKCHPAIKVDQVRMVDGLEEDLDMQLAKSGHGLFALNYRPFEIISLKLTICQARFE